MPAVTVVPAPPFELESPSELPPRQAHFTHIDDNITSPKFDRNKILINTHPEHRDVWIWLIPSATTAAPLALSARPTNWQANRSRVEKNLCECPMLAEILDKAVWENDFPFRSIHAILPT